VTECPEEIRISDRRTCKLIARRAKLVECPHPRVGHGVRVAGISCHDAYGLLTSLGSTAGTHSFKEARQKLTRPAVVRYNPPIEIRDTGWTCWSDFEPDRSYAIQFVCWRGSDVLTFRFS
jgi:hypothetical protein